MQFQVLNKNTWNLMPPDIQTAFMAAAQEAADQGNQIDREGEVTFKQKLKDAKMDIYVPSRAEKAQWQKIGEAVWETQGKGIDPAVIKSMIALR